MSHDDFHAENKLLTRLRRGEELAFSEIYAMHAAGLIRYVFT